MTELTVITDRDLKIAYIKKVVYKRLVKILDAGDFDEDIIKYKDWSALNQCPECHTYFDNGDGTDDDRFCSDECQVDYVEEAPDREER